jgi:hypothetical protein
MPIAPIAENDAWAAEMADAQGSAGVGIIHDLYNGAWVADSVQPEGMVETEIAPGLSSRFQHGTIKGKPMADISDKFLNEYRPFVATSDGVIEMSAVFAGHRSQPFSVCYVGKNTFSFIGGEFTYREQSGQDKTVFVPNQLFTVNPNASTVIGLAIYPRFVPDPENPATGRIAIIDWGVLEARSLKSGAEVVVTGVVAGISRTLLSSYTDPEGTPLYDYFEYTTLGEQFIPLVVLFTTSGDAFWEVTDVVASSWFLNQGGGLQWW